MIDFLFMALIVWITVAWMLLARRLYEPALMHLLRNGGHWDSDATLRARFRGRWWLSITTIVVASSIFQLVMLNLHLHFQAPEVVAAVISMLIVCVPIGVACWSMYNPLMWFCHNCGKRLSSKSEWMCGFCDGDNKNTLYFSFLYRCSHCKAVPAAYECPHCGELTRLLPAGDLRHPARDIPKPLPNETEQEARERRAKELAERQHAIEQLRLEAKIKDLDRQLKQMGEPPDAGRRRWIDEQLESMNLDIDLIARSIQEQRQAADRIRANPDLTAEEIEQLIGHVDWYSKTLRERIRLTVED